MKISQYILQLQLVQEQHGDLEVMLDSRVGTEGRRIARPPEARYTYIPDEGIKCVFRRGVWSPRLDREESKGELVCWLD